MAHKTKRAPFPTSSVKNWTEGLRLTASSESIPPEEKYAYIQNRREELIEMINQNADHWLREISRIHPEWSKSSFRDDFMKAFNLF